MVSAYGMNLPDIPHIVTLAALEPEALVLFTGLVLLLGGVFSGDKSANRMQSMGLYALVALLGLMLVPHMPHLRQTLFSNLFVLDGFSFFVKVLLVMGAALTFLLSDGWLKRPENQRLEYPALILLSLLGMMLMVSANDLISVYLGMELSSLALYVLAAISRDTLKSTESGLKYFVLGALASGIYLFGASLVYGFAGSTSFDALSHLFHSGQQVSQGVVVGLVLVVVAFSFKVSAAPFHMWTPDVYEGAPTPVTAYFSVAPKVAGMALFARILMQPFGGLVHEWQQVIVVVSAASMIVGALGALTQNNIKRLLAYSSVGHAGYALIGLAAGSRDGISGMLIYLALYILMSAGMFAAVLMMMRQGEAVENIGELAGLSRTRPRMAFAIAVFMFSMAGIPPLAGFFAKFYVFLAAIHAGFEVLAVIGVLASVVACYYYLKIVKLMYFDEPAAPFDAEVPPGTRWTLVFCSTLVLLFFLVPAPLVEQAQKAAEALF